MMVLREDIVREARSWIGTPYAHQGRIKGVGVDCVGLVIGVARAMGLSEYDIDGYSRAPDERVFRLHLLDQMDAIAVSDVRPGDVLMFAPLGRLHLGIVSAVGPVSMVHSWAKLRLVCENPLGRLFGGCLRAAFAYRGVS